MKICLKLLALAAPAAAFMVQPPQTLVSMSSARQSDVSPAFSYLGSLQENRPSYTSRPATVDGAVSGSAATLNGDRTSPSKLAQDQDEFSAKTYGRYSAASNDNQAERLWENSKQEHVQGGSLKTWAFPSSALERVQVVMKTEGRPLDADVELWQGPDNTPVKMRVYVEDGSMRPFSAVIATPRGPNTIAIRNIGHLEFPLSAVVVGEAGSPGPVPVARPTTRSEPLTIQGGALRTYPFEPSVESVQVLLKTDGRPLNARIELLQGPNNNKQVIELYTEDGMERPFFCVLETPGSGNVVRVVNTATVEFPMTAWVDAYQVGAVGSDTEPVIGGDSNGFMSSARSW